MRVINLASGSKGNCTLVEGSGSAVLIDCGLDLKRAEELIASVGCNISKICAILVTHTHTDHIKSVVRLAKKYNLKVYATDACWQEGKLQKIELAQRGFITLNDFFVNEFTICPFEQMHDSVSCVGYTIICEGKKFAIATDLGVVTNEIIEKLTGSDLIFIEANYDPHMLRTGSYPAITKRRIASDHGHLSNADCADAICKLVTLGTKHFVLSHISENNNTYELAYGTVKNVLKTKNLDNNIFIGVAFQNKVSSNFILKNN